MAKRDDDTDMVDSFESDDDAADFDGDADLDDALAFNDEELLDDDEMAPSVLFKGVSKPKTEDEWRQLLLEANRDGVPPYLISSTYSEGDLLLHPKFGLGVVSKVLTPRKMEVVYDLNKKLMAMGFDTAANEPSTAS